MMMIIQNFSFLYDDEFRTQIYDYKMIKNFGKNIVELHFGAF